MGQRGQREIGGPRGVRRGASLSERVGAFAACVAGVGWDPDEADCDTERSQSIQSINSVSDRRHVERWASSVARADRELLKIFT